LATLTEPVPVILVTGYPSLASAVQSVELPVVGYLVKPFNVEELLARVRAVAKNCEVRRLLRGELNRLRDYRQGLLCAEAQMRDQPRSGQNQSLQAVVGLTLRNIVEGLAAVGRLASTAEGSDAAEPSPISGQPLKMPAATSQFREAIYDAV